VSFGTSWGPSPSCLKDRPLARDTDSETSSRSREGSSPNGVASERGCGFNDASEDGEVGGDVDSTFGEGVV
jgi:hypothetical protein